ncbi:DUF3127 domain-containing protein [Labilibacter sediminis]|nr:DUF3127 domain-containing protein [Labilibacter sediminis]
MNFELTGNLIVKDDEQSISASFKKREFVVEVINERNSDWNDFIKFQLTQDRCSQLDPFNLGEPVKVSFNIRGRKWEKDGKVNYFSNLEAWRLEKVQASADPGTPPPFTESEVPPAGANEDLPF